MEIGWLNRWRVWRSRRTRYHINIATFWGARHLAGHSSAAAAVLPGGLLVRRRRSCRGCHWPATHGRVTGGLLGFNETNQFIDRLVLDATAAQDLTADIVVVFALMTSGV